MPQTQPTVNVSKPDFDDLIKAANAPEHTKAIAQSEEIDQHTAAIRQMEAILQQVDAPYIGTYLSA